MDLYVLARVLHVLAVVLIAVFLGLAFAPFLFPGVKALSVAAKVLVFIVLVASFDLLLGYTGIVSFAHTMFFGIGAYGVAIASTRMGPGWASLALGVGAAFLASCWATFTQGGEVYFDSVTMFIFFLLGGRYLEMNARQKAISVTEALAKLLPAFAQRLPGFPVERAAEQCVVADLRAGDYVLVQAGAIVPADGAWAKVKSVAISASLARLGVVSRVRPPGRWPNVV